MQRFEAAPGETVPVYSPARAVVDAMRLGRAEGRFLYRVSIHPLGRQHFVLKGGLLLAQFGARRVTRDIDILGRAFPGDEQEIISRITQIAVTPVDDGVTFEPGTLTTVPIRRDDEYHGLRLAMNALGAGLRRCE